MHSVVWVREIWDTRDLVGDVLDASGRPRWAGWEGRFDPEDLNALEMALQIKDTDPHGEVTAISGGPPRKMDVLRECLYRGVDRVVRLSTGDETIGILGEARLVARALEKLSKVDALFTGIQINEGEYAQRGAMVARLLNWPLVSYVEAVDGVEDGRMELRRAIEGGIQVVDAPWPVVVSVGVALVKEDPRAPRSAKAKLKLKHKKTGIPEWGVADLGISDSTGISPARIVGYRPLEQRSFPSRRVDGTSEEELRQMLVELREQGLVR